MSTNIFPSTTPGQDIEGKPMYFTACQTLMSHSVFPNCVFTSEILA